MIRRRAGWWVAGLTAIFALVALAVLLRPVSINRSGSRATQAAPKISVVPLDGGGSKLLREQATIFDPTPLFLPTKWNASQRPLPANVQRQPGQVFRAYPPQLMYGDAALKLPIKSAQSLPKSPVDLLKEPSHNPFLGFDRQDILLTPLHPRQAFVEVSQARTGKKVFTRSIGEDAHLLPKGSPDWKPAEFLIAVTPAGLLGRPVNTVSSDIEEVDTALRDYLATTLRLGERLPPGMYRVVVGP